MSDEKKPVSNKPVQVSNAPPPISPLRGGFIPKKNESDRLPRWSKWRLMPEVKEWEAVALSLNIEPEKIKKNSKAWMGAAHPFDEGDDFNDRLTVLNKQSSNRAHFPTPCILNMADWYNCEVRLDEFAAWCIHVGFEIPPELAALAKAATQAAPMVESAPVATPSGDDKPWLVANPKDPEPDFLWYIPARYFARQLVKDDSTLLVKRATLAEKTAASLASVGIFKRGNKKPLSSGTVLKSFVNVTLS